MPLGPLPLGTRTAVCAWGFVIQVSAGIGDKAFVGAEDMKRELSGAILIGTLLVPGLAAAQSDRTPPAGTAGTANDPTVGDNSAPSSLSGPAGAVQGSPIRKDTTIPGTAPGDHLGSERDAGSKGK